MTPSEVEERMIAISSGEATKSPASSASPIATASASETANPRPAISSTRPRSRSKSISRPARKSRNESPTTLKIAIGSSVGSTQSRPEGPIAIPATISSTTAGSTRRGKSPSTKGAPKATAATISKPVNETSGTGPPSGRSPVAGAQLEQGVEVDLRERREGLDRVVQHIQRDARPDRERRLLEPLPGLRAERVGAGQTLAVGDEGQKAGSLRIGAGVGRGARHFRDLRRRAQLPLGLPHGGRLGVREHDARDGVVGGFPVLAEDVGGGDAPLVLADVGQRPDPGYVADRPDAVAGPHPGIDLDALPPGLDPDGVEPEVLAVAPRARGVLAEAQLDPVGGEDLAKRLAERARFARQQVILALDERDLRAEAADRLGELDSNGPPAQHEQPPRRLFETRGFAACPQSVELVESRDRRDRRVRSGGDDDVLRLVGLAGDLDPARARNPARAPDQVDPGALEPVRLSRVVVVGDLEVAPAERLADVELAASRLAGPGRLAGVGERLAGAQQGLRGDARPVRALAADQLAFHNRDAQPALGQPGRAVLTGRAGSDDDHVVGLAHGVLLSMVSGTFATSPARSMSAAALIRPMWLKACGKLPSSSPLAASTSSASRPRSLA